MTDSVSHQQEELPVEMQSSKLKPSFSWQGIFSLLMFFYMYLPILVLTFYSFNESAYSAKWQGFTLEWYIKLFSDVRVLKSLQNSLTVAFVAVVISAVIGTLMAVGLVRYQFMGKGLYRGVSYLPLIIPDIAMAVATLVFLAVIGTPLSLWTIVAAHVVFCLAYIAFVVSSRISSLDPYLEEAALDLGATPFQAFIQVLLPELMPAIIAGCLISFVLSMDDFLIASFTAGTGSTTLPMEIFSRIRTGVKPDINALSVILIGASGAIAFVGEWLRYQGEKKRLR
ncbi:ABC transporter permease [Coleofasciculus chthonoplastes]|jgi:spermidine/putrescine transport system permease protein|uniref:ABC transporter permease n=1 Tax=Coleofasciculus chthonoplastes TaxID=64178 RepID=UPI0032FA187E